MSEKEEEDTGESHSISCLEKEVKTTAECHGVINIEFMNLDELVISINPSSQLDSNLREPPEARAAGSEEPPKNKDENDLFCKIKCIAEEIIKAAECRGMTLTDFVHEVTIPEYATSLSTSNLVSPEYRIKDDSKGDSNHPLHEMKLVTEEITKTAECHGITLTNFVNWNTDHTPENSCFLVSILKETPESRISEDNNDPLHEMNQVTEEIIKTIESHGMLVTNFVTWDKIAIPESSSCLLDSNLEESPESKITGNNEEIKEDNNNPLCDMNTILEEIVKTAERHGMTFRNSVNWNEVAVQEGKSSCMLDSNLEKSPKTTITEDTEGIKQDNNNSLCETNKLLEVMVKTLEHYGHGMIFTNSVNWNEGTVPENSSRLLDSLVEESAEIRITGDNEDIKEENNNPVCKMKRILEETVKNLEYHGHGMNCTNSSNWKEVSVPENPSHLLDSLVEESPETRSAGMGEVVQNKNLEEPQPMAATSEKNSENQGKVTQEFFQLNNIKEDLKNTMKKYRLTLTDFVHLKGAVSENSLTLTTSNFEMPQVNLAGDNEGAQEQLQFLQLKPKASPNLLVDMQQTFERHGLTLENVAASGMIQVGESPSLSETEILDEESGDFPEPPAKRQQKFRGYVIEGIVKKKDQLPGSSGINPTMSRAIQIARTKLFQALNQRQINSKDKKICKR